MVSVITGIEVVIEVIVVALKSVEVTVLTTALVCVESFVVRAMWMIVLLNNIYQISEPNRSSKISSYHGAVTVARNKSLQSLLAFPLALTAFKHLSEAGQNP